MSIAAHFHLPGAFEFYELYSVFLPLYHEHREYFYDWCDIGSVYGAPSVCLWGGGRVGYGENDTGDVLRLFGRYGISVRLTFSNSLIRREHLSDRQCNELCRKFSECAVPSGVVIHSDLLLGYLREHYPKLYFVSSTTKVMTDTDALNAELSREEFRYVVPDFRLNKCLSYYRTLSAAQKDKVELLCNECCFTGCTERRECYENVSRMALGESCPEHICCAPDAGEGYVFSKAMQSPMFIGIEDICNVFLPMGISNFKIEGRSLGSAMILEFLLYYMTKPEHQLRVRESIYLSSSLDLF